MSAPEPTACESDCRHERAARAARLALHVNLGNPLKGADLFTAMVLLVAQAVLDAVEPADIEECLKQFDANVRESVSAALAEETVGES